jgi:hypothetical protein
MIMCGYKVYITVALWIVEGCLKLLHGTHQEELRLFRLQSETECDNINRDSSIASVTYEAFFHVDRVPDELTVAY